MNPYIKIQNFSLPKDTVNKVEMQATEWEKIPIIHIFNKELVFLIQKLFIHKFIMNKEKTDSLFKIPVKDLTRQFTKKKKSLS